MILCNTTLNRADLKFYHTSTLFLLEWSGLLSQSSFVQIDLLICMTAIPNCCMVVKSFVRRAPQPCNQLTYQPSQNAVPVPRADFTGVDHQFQMPTANDITINPGPIFTTLAGSSFSLGLRNTVSACLVLPWCPCQRGRLGTGKDLLP